MYESYYQFSDKPFRLRPDPHFFFASKGHKRAMAYLEYGLSQGEGFIVITGEVGAGKTTLVRNLFNRLPKDKIVAAHIVNTHLDADDTLRMVVSSFGLPLEGSKADLLTRLEHFLRFVDQQGKRALLVIDEAQNLKPRTVEELRMLSNFQTEERPLLQTFLLGQPEFRVTLHSPDMQQLRQRVIASYHLGPMEAAETRAYIEHRLATVGWNGDPSFSDAALAEVHAYSGGIPRKVNTLMDRVLLMGYLEELHGFDEEHIRTVIRDIADEFRLPEGAGLADAAAVPAAAREAVLRGGEVRTGGQLAGLDAPELAAAHPDGHTDERLVRLEKSLVSVLSLLKKVVGDQPGVEDKP
ncbi:ATPase [Massilia sp. KIM]|uniref:XrtA/PEP-CTERM system-associated ATPase n=1 Tax=Massilia sp. KIM TaxID=1955422 RepID=UPI00098FF161|nr:XrtA/PEP-CTERM system-associated ATPase [Massilia sp. KIM]OON59518.1 ATPase [Massilia sp. KIM]